MHECYAMQILEKKKQRKQKQQRGMVHHKEYSDEAQGPCQKDSIRSNFLHPKLYKCNFCIRVIIHIRMMSNSKIGIKV